ncbi:MAG: FAD-binding protein [Actinomycetales bacterium]|nr:FAD-binding protein [Actinomycetales bacterium]
MMRTNWSGHVAFAAERCENPRSEDELRRLVASTPRLHAVGTGHSFNDVADTDGVQVSLAEMPQRVEVDGEARIARISAGMRFGQAARQLNDGGWAVANLASLGHIGVAGTVATGTHGSGDRNATLSALVRGLRTLRADGSIEDVRDADLAGEVVGLGALGIVTEVDLVIEPAFEVGQYVFDGVSHEALLADFDVAFGSAYSVSVFTTWEPSLTGRAWLKRRLDTDGPWTATSFLDGTPALTNENPVPGADPANCTRQLGTPGPWHERLPHFRLDHTPSSGDELQTEYLVPRDQAVAGLRDLEALAPRIRELLLVCEIRTMAADDLWLSGASGRATVGLHFTWQRRPEVLDLLPALDEVLAPRGGRPHWGKLFSASAESVRQRYPRFDDFAALVGSKDPTGRFRNRMLDWLLS